MRAASSLIGTFEDGTSGGQSWNGEPSSAARVVADPTYRGDGALRLTAEGSDPARAVHARAAVAAGQRVAAAAYARPIKGSQALTLEFLDVNSRVLEASEAATPSTNSWSRVSVVRVAPHQASWVRVVLRASQRSDAVWDEVRLTHMGVPNGDLEAWASGVPDGWTVFGGPTSLRRSPRSHGGESALVLAPAAAGAKTAVRTPFIPVLADAEHVFRSWIRASSSSSVMMVVTWYDADLLPLRSVRHPVSAGDGWTADAFVEAAPSAAEFATLTLEAGPRAVGDVLWDDITVTLTEPRPDESFDITGVSTLDGFLSTAAPRIVTVQGRAKLVTVVSGNPASVQMVDLVSGALEHRKEIPGLTNGWAITVGKDGRRLYLSGDEGHLMSFDADTGVLTDLGRATADATEVFGLARAPDGRIWGASYPRGEVWFFDPTTSEFTSLGSAEPGAEYAHSIAVDAERVYVGVGPIRPKIIAIQIDDPGSRAVIPPPVPIRQGFVSELAVQQGLVAARFPGDRYGLYDVRTGRWREGSDPSGAVQTQFPTVSLADRPFVYLSQGRLWKARRAGSAGPATELVAVLDLPPSLRSTVVGTTVEGASGAWLFTHDGETTVRAIDVSRQLAGTSDTAGAVGPVRVFRIGLRPSPLRVKSLAAGNDGLVYVGGFGGPSLAAFTTDGGLMTRYPRKGDPTRGAIGEIEGMTALGRYQFLGSYTGARILRFDTSLPWDDGTNPVQVASLGSLQQDRPAAWAASDGRAYFGTVPKYGLLGGALGWVDGSDAAATVIRSPIADQSIVSLAAQGHVLYAGTSRWGGLGATPMSDSGILFAYDTDARKLLWTLKPTLRSQAISSLLRTDSGELWAVSGAHLVQIDAASGRVVRDMRLWAGTPTGGPTYSSTQMTSANGRIYVAGFGGLYSVDPATLRVVAVQASGVAPSKVTSTGRDLFYPMLTQLVRARR